MPHVTVEICKLWIIRFTALENGKRLVAYISSTMNNVWVLGAIFISKLNFVFEYPPCRNLSPWLLFLKSNKIGLANNQLLEKLYAKDSNLSQNVYKKKTVKFVLLEPLNNAKNGGIRLAEWRCAPLPHIPTSFRSRTLSSIVTSRRCRIIHRFYSKFTICHYSFCMK